MVVKSNNHRMINRSHPYAFGLAPWAMVAGCALAGVALAGVLTSGSGASAAGTAAALAASIGVAAHVLSVTALRRPVASIIPIGLLAMSAATAVGLSGGLTSPAVAALLWPGLALLVLGGPIPGGLAVWVAAIGVAIFLGTFTSPTGGSAAWASVLSVGFAGLLAASAVSGLQYWRNAGADRARTANTGDMPPSPNSTDSALRAELQEAREQSAGRARFMAEMSHEIRTPLNAILGFADAMRLGVFGPLPDHYSEYAGHIHDSGSQLLDLVSDLLDLSKIDAGRYALKLDTVDLTIAAQEAVRQSSALAQANGVQLRTMAGAAVHATVDARALRQMLANLLSNAIKFTPAGGRITVRAFVRDEAVGIEVIDTGVGMTADQLKRVAEPYAQADNQPAGARGTGLGLALVKRLAELHGGRFELVSAPGEGSTARIVVPSASAGALQVAQDSRA
jgi:signal transduction histidine kinase